MTNPRHQLTPTQALFKAQTLEQLEVLVAQGADVNAVNKKGATPIFDAVRKSRSDMVNSLLSAGARVDLRDDRGMPLCLAAARSFLPQIVDDLVAAGMDPFLTDANGNTGMMVAVTPLVLHKLLSLGLDVNATNKEGKAPLHCIVEANTFVVPQAFSVLVAAGANINARDNKGMTPLMFAGRSEYVNALLAVGADPSLVDVAGQNVLHHIVKARYAINPSCLEALVVAGADLFAPDQSGKTAREILSSSQAARVFGSFGSFEEIDRALASGQAQLLNQESPPTRQETTTPRLRF